MIFTIAKSNKKYTEVAEVQSYIDFIKDNSSKIKEIELNGHVFCPKPAAAIFDALKTCKGITKITLRNAFTTLPEEVMHECLKIVVRSFDPRKITHFDMSDNALSCNFLAEFSQFLCNLTKCEIFKLRNCGLGAVGFANLAKCFRENGNRSVVEIDLSQNRATDGVIPLSELLVDFVHLEKIMLKHNSINAKTMAALLENLADSNLNVLDIQDNAIDTEGCAVIGKNLSKWDLTSLNLSDCLVNDECIESLVNNFNKFFQREVTQGGLILGGLGLILDISNNNISQKGFALLPGIVKKLNVEKLLIFNNVCDDLKGIKKSITNANSSCEIIDEEILDDETFLGDDLAKQLDKLSTYFCIYS